MKIKLSFYTTLFVFFSFSYTSTFGQYCMTAGPSSVFDSEITSVALQGETKNITNLNTCPGFAGVQDFTSQSADVAPGVQYSLQVAFGTCGGTYSNAGEAWIDWNKNFVFEPSESIGTWSGAPTSNQTFNFTVPVTAQFGVTRLRVMQYEGGINPLNPCASFTWGAVEDYSIEILSNTTNDAGIVGFSSPPNPLVPGTYNVEVDIRNYGSDSLESIKIDWEINGVQQTQITHQITPKLPQYAVKNNIVLGSHTFGQQLTTVKAYTSLPNNITDDFFRNDTVETIFCSGLAGTYTLGSPTADFVDIAALESALLTCGIAGPTVIEVLPGVHQGNLNLFNIMGLSAINNLTIKGQNPQNTVITSDGSGANNATIKIEQSSYITFKNLTIQNTSSAVARVFMIFNQSNYITIDSCEVVSDDQDDLFSFQVTNILMGPSTTSTFTEGDNGNHFKLLNSKIIGGEYGFVAEHQFNSLGIDIQLVNNQFVSQLDGAVRIDNIDSLVFSNNECIGLRNQTATALTFETLKNFVIAANEVYNVGRAMVMTQVNDTTGFLGLFANNILKSENTTGSQFSTSNTIQLYHNTFDGNPALQMSNCEGIDFRNNIVQSLTSFSLVTSNTIFNLFDYNLYYGNGQDLFNINSAVYSTLTDLKTNLPFYNQNSVFGNPNFLSSNNYRIIFGLTPNDAGDPTVPILFDIDGDLRPANGSTNPDIGADEFTPPQKDLGVIDFLKPSTNCYSNADSIAISIGGFGTNNLFFSTDSFKIIWNITGPINQSGIESFISDSLLAGDTLTVHFSQQGNFSEPGDYTFTAYIEANWDSIALNDTLIKKIIVPVMLKANNDTLITLPGAIFDLKAVSSGSNKPVFSEIVQFSSGTGATSPYPAFIPSIDFDMIEISALSAVSDLSGFVVEVYQGTLPGPNFVYTIPQGVVIVNNEVLLLGFSSGTDLPQNKLYWMNGINTSSATQNGYILKDPNGNIVDVVATNSFQFPVVAGVDTTHWKGNIPSSSSRSGVSRVTGDSNLATDWVVASATNLQTIGTFNPGLQKGAPGSILWYLDTTLIDTVSTITVGPFNTNGTYQYIVSDSTPCGFKSDTVFVVVDIPFSANGTVDLAIDSVKSSDAYGCELSDIDIKMVVTNQGTDTVYFMPAYYSVNNGPITSEIIVDTVYPGNTKTIEFLTQAALSGSGNYTIKAWVAVPGDTLPIADTNFTVFVNNPLPVTPTVPGNQSYCPGDNISKLHVIGAGGQFNWFGSASLDTASFLGMGDSLMPSITPGVNSYYVTETDSIGCVSQPAMVIVGIYGYPNISAGDNTSVCIGDTLLLQANGGVTYLWSTGSNQSTAHVAPQTPTVYSVTGTDVNGCVGADTILVTIDTLPNVSLGAFNNVCLNTSPFTLTGGVPGGGIYWGAGISNNVLAPGQMGIGTDTVYYTYTNAKGCSNTAFNLITVDTLPNVFLNSFPSICLNAQAFQLTGGTPSGGVFTGAGVNNGFFNPNQAGVGIKFVTYTYTDGNGCPNSVVQSIRVLGLPNVSLGSFGAICEDYLPFKLYGGQPAGGSYTGPGVVNDSLFPAIAGSGTKSITYSVTNSDGCTNSAFKTIQINAKPLKPSIFQVGDDTLTADINAPVYYWSFNNLPYPGNTQSIQAIVSGEYFVNAINGACTSEQSEGFTFYVLQVDELDSKQIVEVYPNPFVNQLIIKQDKLIEKLSEIEIIDISGKLIFEKSLANERESFIIDTKEFAPGIYTVNCKQGVKTVTFKLVKP